MIIQQDWLVRNSSRKYPLDDLATATSDDGKYLHEDIVVDAQIWAPKYVYQLSPLRRLTSIYISAVACTPALMSLTLLGSAEVIKGPAGSGGDASEIFVPLGTLCLPKPVVPYKNYAISSLLPGLMGWIAFGPGVNRDNELYAFSTPKQSALLPRCVHTYDSAPVTGFKVLLSDKVAKGDVSFYGADPISATVQEVTVGGVVKQALVLSMEKSAEILESFAGPCKGRPESGSCNKVPITSIAGVTPDCAGNLTINTQGLTIRWLTDGTGFCVDSTVALNSVCGQNSNIPNADGSLKSDFPDGAPCNFSAPYNLVVDDDALTYDKGGFVPMSGSFFVGKSGGSDAVLGIGSVAGCSIGPCIPAYPSSTAQVDRTIKATMTIPSGFEGGVYVMDTGVHRIELRADGAYKVIKGQDPSLAVPLGAPGGTTAVVSWDGSVGSLNGYTFEAGDSFWKPAGTCGVWCRATTEGTFGVVPITEFSISDTPQPTV